MLLRLVVQRRLRRQGSCVLLKVRRRYAIQYVRNNNIQGYLAYSGGKVVGWCNANTKADCLKCYCWRRFMGDIPTEDPGAGIRVKSVFCFAVAPEMRRKGITKLLLERVCQDAAQDGFDFVEAYPNKKYIDEAEDYMGPAELFIKSGFTVYHVSGQYKCTDFRHKVHSDHVIDLRCSRR